MNRSEICASAGAKLASARVSELRAAIGLDGFVDEICAVVDTRSDFEHYVPIDTIATLGKKILAAAGQSSNYELVVKQMKLGGNGPIMANALACAGARVTYVGATGYPTRHAVFDDFAKVATVVGICEPGHTDAVEFTDGKLMLGKLTTLADLSWENIEARFGEESFLKLLQDARLIALNNWTMVPKMSQMLAAITEKVLPKLTGPRRTLFIDLADPEKRTRDDLLSVLRLMTGMQKHVDVTLGLNLKESVQAAEVLSLAQSADPESHIEQTAAAIRSALGISCVVIHPRKGAAAADHTGATASFSGPFVREPRISTGAGDHFNAGFALGRTLGLSLAESLCVGVATSGFYVREAKSPSQAELADFVRNLPPPQ